MDGRCAGSFTACHLLLKFLLLVYFIVALSAAVITIACTYFYRMLLLRWPFVSSRFDFFRRRRVEIVLELSVTVVSEVV
jgi:hypothetical protein